MIAEKSHSLPLTSQPEPEFVNLLRVMNSIPGGPVRQPYFTYRSARLHRLTESIPGLLKRLQILVQDNDYKLSISTCSV